MGLRKNSRSVSEKTFNTKLLQYNRLQCDVSYILLEAAVEIHSLLVRQSRNKYGKYIFCCKHSNIIFYSDVIILNEKLPATTTITTRCWPCFILKTLTDFLIFSIITRLKKTRLHNHSRLTITVSGKKLRYFGDFAVSQQVSATSKHLQVFSSTKNKVLEPVFVIRKYFHVQVPEREFTMLKTFWSSSLFKVVIFQVLKKIQLLNHGLLRISNVYIRVEHDEFAS